MKKEGDWIAVMDPGLRVSRLLVEASPMLDLVEVRRVNHDCTPGQPLFLDRSEAARLRAELGAALDQLEEAAVEAGG